MFSCVNVLKIDQSFVHLDCVLILLNLSELVLLRQQSIDREIILIVNDILEMHINKNHAEVVFGKI